MPLPISKVKERDRQCEAQFDPAELMNILPLIQLNPVMLVQEKQHNRKERDAIREVWLNSSDVNGDQMEITPGVSNTSLAFLQSKGFIKGDGKRYKFTANGRRLLKEAILEDEQSEFCKQASKQLVSKNSYDFGNEVLVRVNDPEKFGARYVCLSKKVFAKKNMKPKNMDEYVLATRTESGDLKGMRDYSDEDLIAVLRLAKKIIKNASTISARTGKSVPVNRIKAFSKMVMSELNLKK